MPLPLLVSAGLYWPLPTTSRNRNARLGRKPAKSLRKDGCDQEARGKSGGTGQDRRGDGDFVAIDRDDRLCGEQRARQDWPRIRHRRRGEHIERLRQTAAFDRPGRKSAETVEARKLRDRGSELSLGCRQCCSVDTEATRHADPAALVRNRRAQSEVLAGRD